MTGDPSRIPTGAPSEADHAVRYESLRVYAIERRALSSRDGLVVLLRLGVGAWMDAWSSLPVPQPTRTDREQASPLPEDASAEVVRVLAAMTWSHIEEVSA
jgi:hypothetical protein